MIEIDNIPRDRLIYPSRVSRHLSIALIAIFLLLHLFGTTILIFFRRRSLISLPVFKLTPWHYPASQAGSDRDPVAAPNLLVSLPLRPHRRTVAGPRATRSTPVSVPRRRDRISSGWRAEGCSRSGRPVPMQKQKSAFLKSAPERSPVSQLRKKRCRSSSQVISSSTLHLVHTRFYYRMTRLLLPLLIKERHRRFCTPPRRLRPRKQSSVFSTSSLPSAYCVSTVASVELICAVFLPSAPFGALSTFPMPAAEGRIRSPPPSPQPPHPSNAPPRSSSSLPGLPLPGPSSPHRSSNVPLSDRGLLTCSLRAPPRPNLKPSSRSCSNCSTRRRRRLTFGTAIMSSRRPPDRPSPLRPPRGAAASTLPPTLAQRQRHLAAALSDPFA